MPQITLTVSAADGQRILDAINSGRVPNLPANATPKDFVILAVQTMVQAAETPVTPPPIAIT